MIGRVVPQPHRHLWLVAALSCSSAGFGSSDAPAASCDPDSLLKPWASQATLSGAASMATGDFNADGEIDLAVVHTIARVVRIWKGLPTGAFGISADITFPVQPLRIAAADLDLDGRLDLVVSAGAGRMFVILGAPAGAFLTPMSVTVSGGPLALAVIDINGDALPDVIATNTATGQLISMISDGTTTDLDFTISAIPSGGTVSAQPDAILASDFNQDGINDLAVALRMNDRIAVLMGNGVAGAGDGTFATAVLYDVETEPRALGYADVNGDGVRDLIYGAALGAGYLPGLAQFDAAIGPYDAAAHFFPLFPAAVRGVEARAWTPTGRPILSVRRPLPGASPFWLDER